MLPKLEEIKAKRKNLGLTQNNLAKLAGVSQSLLVKIEAGTVIPTYEKARNIFSALESVEIKNQKIASDLMKKEVLFAKGHQPLEKIASLMKQNGISQLPVIDDYGIIIGSISEHSIIDHISSGKTASFVSEVLDDALPTVSPKTPLLPIIALLKHQGAVLVIDKRKIVGIITKSDII